MNQRGSRKDFISGIEKRGKTKEVESEIKKKKGWSQGGEELRGLGKGTLQNHR